MQYTHIINSELRRDVTLNDLRYVEIWKMEWKEKTIKTTSTISPNQD